MTQKNVSFFTHKTRTLVTTFQNPRSREHPQQQQQPLQLDARNNNDNNDNNNNTVCLLTVFCHLFFDCGNTAACFHAPTTALTGIVGANGTRAVLPQ